MRRSVDENVVAVFFRLVLGDGDGEHTIFVLGLDLLFVHIAHVVAAAVTCGTLSAQIFAVRLVLLLLGGNCDVAALKFEADVLLVQTGHFHVHHVVFVRFFDVRLHKAGFAIHIEGAEKAVESLVKEVVIVAGCDIVFHGSISFFDFLVGVEGVLAIACFVC